MSLDLFMESFRTVFFLIRLSAIASEIRFEVEKGNQKLELQALLPRMAMSQSLIEMANIAQPQHNTACSIDAAS